MTRISNRLDKLEGLQQLEDFTLLFIATETTPGRYQLDDGRKLSNTELDALPGSGSSSAGLVICLPSDDNDR